MREWIQCFLISLPKNCKEGMEILYKECSCPNQLVQEKSGGCVKMIFPHDLLC